MSRRPAAIPPRLLAVARSQGGLVSIGQCTAAGVPRDRVTRAARDGRWHRVARGVYDIGPSSRPNTLDRWDLERLRRAVLGPLTIPGSVATGQAALVLHGIKGVPVGLRPEVALPDGTFRDRAGVRVRRSPLRRWDLVKGLPCATVEDALAQAVPDLDRHDAVAVLDSALYRAKITPDGLDLAHRAASGRPGVFRTHSWWEEADGRAESPAETWARLSCRDADVPPDTLQLPVVDARGHFLARVDLAWLLPDGRVLLVEVDGHDPHSTPEALFRDRSRQNRIVTQSTIVRRYTGREARNGRLAREVTMFLTGCGWEPASRDLRNFTV